MMNAVAKAAKNADVRRPHPSCKSPSCESSDGIRGNEPSLYLQALQGSKTLTHS